MTAEPMPVPKGGDDNGAGHALGGAVDDLGQPGGVGVVERVGRALQDPGHELVDVHALPGLVEVGDEDGGAAHNGGGYGDAHGHVRGDAEPLDNGAADLGDRLGRGWSGGLDAHALADELTGPEIDQGALDARSADVDPACHLGH